jgi:hypothetical protein
MSSGSLTFDAVAEARAGAKWRARWDRSWPEYRAWFLALRFPTIIVAGCMTPETNWAPKLASYSSSFVSRKALSTSG